MPPSSTVAVKVGFAQLCLGVFISCLHKSAHECVSVSAYVGYSILNHVACSGAASTGNGQSNHRTER